MGIAPFERDPRNPPGPFPGEDTEKTVRAPTLNRSDTESARPVVVVFQPPELWGIQFCHAEAPAAREPKRKVTQV